VSLIVDEEALGDVTWPTDGVVRLLRRGDWTVAEEPLDAAHKGPHRYGPFKEAFRHDMVFVYGTQGTPEENAWMRAKTRFDAETFWYRGNGSIDVVPDVAFDAASEPDRCVILYGNAQTNTAWRVLLGDSPVQVRRGRVELGDRSWSGDDLGCLLVRPRPGSKRAMVAAVAGSGHVGMRLTERLPYFVSGVAYPDVLVINAAALQNASDGVRATGFFGSDWSVETGEFAFGE
jgi:hypothetical protein